MDKSPAPTDIIILELTSYNWQKVVLGHDLLDQECIYVKPMYLL